MGRRKGEERTSSWNSLSVLGGARRCAIVVRGGRRCAYCRIRLTKRNAEIDHVVPRAVGGDDSEGNLVASCGLCNLARLAEGGIEARLKARGITLFDVGAEVHRQITTPCDRAAGAALARRWYPWEAARAAKNREAQRGRDRARRGRQRAAIGAGLGGASFPFGAAA